MQVIDWGVFRIHVCDCVEAMRTMPDASVDSIVTDPPYGLTSARPGGRSAATRGAVMGGFMGLTWDSGVPGVEVWSEVLRVLKPGGHLLAFGGSRTYHRLACAIEDAGFEVRDQIMWLYGSGFPKSHSGDWGGTALKPAHEPIVLARKTLVGTVETNWAQWGTGALNIDESRVPTGDKLGGGDQSGSTKVKAAGWDRPWMQDGAAKAAHAARVNTNVAKAEALGRWPANVLHDGSAEVLSAFPQAPGQQGKTGTRTQGAVYGTVTEGEVDVAPRGDVGSAARFFYCAKASRTDRGEGNTHPTVKPTDLMRYLVRLVTPPGGVVFDPFCGSGSTGKAAVPAGFKFVGAELNPEYARLAERRISQALFGSVA